MFPRIRARLAAAGRDPKPCEKDETEELLALPGVRVFDLSGGRPMKGWLLVGPEATRTPAGFKHWLARAVAWSGKAKKPAIKRRAK